jgi:hypothetical protein
MLNLNRKNFFILVAVIGTLIVFFLFVVILILLGNVT